MIIPILNKNRNTEIIININFVKKSRPNGYAPIRTRIYREINAYLPIWQVSIYLSICPVDMDVQTDKYGLIRVNVHVLMTNMYGHVPRTILTNRALISSPLSSSSLSLSSPDVPHGRHSLLTPPPSVPLPSERQSQHSAPLLILSRLGIGTLIYEMSEIFYIAGEVELVTTTGNY